MRAGAGTAGARPMVADLVVGHPAGWRDKLAKPAQPRKARAGPSSCGFDVGAVQRPVGRGSLPAIAGAGWTAAKVRETQKERVRAQRAKGKVDARLLPGSGRLLPPGQKAFWKERKSKKTSQKIREKGEIKNATKTKG